MRLRRRKTLSADFDGAVRRAVMASFAVELDPAGLVSALPPEFRDAVNAAHRDAQEARRLAQAAEQRVSELEHRLEAEGTESERLAHLESELARLVDVLRSSHNVPFQLKEQT